MSPRMRWLVHWAWRRPDTFLGNWETITLLPSIHTLPDRRAACDCTMAAGFDLGSGADGEDIASVTLAGPGGGDGTRQWSRRNGVITMPIIGIGFPRASRKSLPVRMW